MERSNPSFGATVLVLAALVVVLAGMRVASDIVVPFLIAVFLATLTGPIVFWLHRLRIPKLVAILIVVVAVAGFVTLIGSVAVNSFQEFNENLPSYQDRLSLEMENLTGWLQEAFNRFGLETLYTQIWDRLRDNITQVAENILRQVGSVLTKAFLVVLTVVFMLLEGFRLRSKLTQALGQSEKTWTDFKTFAKSVQTYLAIKTVTSLGTGLAAGLWVWILGVDYPVFWGLLAFLFNYIPNIGSIIAAIPAVLMAIVQHGGSTGLLVALGYLAINVFIGSLIEPQFMGDGVGLSPLIVLMSLVFWGWLLGGVGMLLSTPLTISVKIALENYPETRWIATLIGSGKT